MVLRGAYHEWGRLRPEGVKMREKCDGCGVMDGCGVVDVGTYHGRGRLRPEGVRVVGW